MQKSKTTKLADAFGILGYLSCMLLWLWAALLLVPWLSSLSSVKRIIIEQPAPAHPVAAQTNYMPPEWLLYLIVASVFFILLVSIVYVVKLPGKTARSASRVTHVAAHRLALEMVHTPRPAKKRLFELTEAIVWAIKAVLVLVPVMVVAAAEALVVVPFELSVVLAVTLYLVSWPVVWFLLQFIVTAIDRRRRPNTPAF